MNINSKSAPPATLKDWLVRMGWLFIVILSVAYSLSATKQTLAEYPQATLK